MDISHTLEPASEQLDAIELIGGPRTFVIESVSKGPADQPVQVHLDGFPRPWRPGKSMRRVLAACWGTDASVYVGRRVTLFCDESIVFGKERVGGTRIAALSHLDKPKSIPLLVSRGKSAMYTVAPLTEPTPVHAPSAADVAACTDLTELAAMHAAATSPELRALIRARKVEITKPVEITEPVEITKPADGALIPGASS